MNIYNVFKKEDAPLVTSQIDDFKGLFQGVSISHNIPLTLSTILKLLPFIENKAKLFVTTPEFLGYDKAAIEYLKERDIFFDINKVRAAQGDIYLDCSANFHGNGLPKAIVELTQTGAKIYEKLNSPIPIISIDDTRTKILEDYLGTGDGFVRAFKENVSKSLKRKHFIVWGYGKVGKGLVRALLAEGARCTVIDLLEQNLQFAIKKGADAVHPANIKAMTALIKSAHCLITSSGMQGLVSLHPLAKQIGDSKLVLANMGALDEFGPAFSDTRVLHRKMAFNFILKEPTKLKFLDPIFYAHNLAAKLFVEGKLTVGYQPLPAEFDHKIVTDWCKYWKQDQSEILEIEEHSHQMKEKMKSAIA